MNYTKDYLCAIIWQELHIKGSISGKKKKSDLMNICSAANILGIQINLAIEMPQTNYEFEHLFLNI